MKKTFIFLIAVIVLSMINSCDKARYIWLDRHYVETTYEEQDLEFHTDKGMAGCTSYGEELESKEDSEMISITYDWYKIIIKKPDRKTVIVHLDENNTGEDRSVKLYVGITFPDDTVRIVQKAKPVL